MVDFEYMKRHLLQAGDAEAVPGFLWIVCNHQDNHFIPHCACVDQEKKIGVCACTPLLPDAEECCVYHWRIKIFRVAPRAEGKKDITSAECSNHGYKGYPYRRVIEKVAIIAADDESMTIEVKWKGCCPAISTERISFTKE